MCVMTKTKTHITISAQVPVSLAKKLEKLAKAESRSKSYYIKNALENMLERKEEDVQDLIDATNRYEEFLHSEEEAVSIDDAVSKCSF